MFDEAYRREMDRVTLTAGEKETIIQLLEEENPMKTRKYTFKAVLVAAVLAVAMLVSALAVELTVGWENFLGRTPKDAVTAVGESAVMGDHTLTLQEAIVDDHGVAFLLALTRNDGGVIEGDPQINGNIYHWDVKVDGEYPNMSRSALPPSIRSEDGKTVYYCTEFENENEDSESLVGRTVTFLCRGLADMDWSEEELAMTKETVSLAPLASVAQRVDMSYKDITVFGKENEELNALVAEQSKQAAIPLARMDSTKVKVSAVLFVEDGLAVAVGDDEDLCRQGDYLISGGNAVSLRDTRTGETWGCNGYVRQGAGDEFFYLSIFKDCPLTEEDIPFVEVTVYYRMEKVLFDQPVELSFLIPEGRQMTKMLDQNVDFFYYGDCSSHVTQARASALRVRLSVDRMDRKEWLSGPERETAQANTLWTLVQKDGSQISLKVTSDRFDEELGAGWLDLEAQNEDGERQLIDPDKVEALMVGETLIPLK